MIHLLTHKLHSILLLLFLSTSISNCLPNLPPVQPQGVWLPLSLETSSLTSRSRSTFLKGRLRTWWSESFTCVKYIYRNVDIILWSSITIRTNMLLKTKFGKVRKLMPQVYTNFKSSTHVPKCHIPNYFSFTHIQIHTSI